MARLFRVSLPAPQIVTAILDGRQPMAMTTSKLLQTDLPLGWTEQMAMLGVD